MSDSERIDEDVVQRVTEYAGEFNALLADQQMQVPTSIDNPFDYTYAALVNLSLNIMSTYVGLRLIEDQLQGQEEADEHSDGS